MDHTRRLEVYYAQNNNAENILTPKQLTRFRKKLNRQDRIAAASWGEDYTLPHKFGKKKGEKRGYHNHDFI